MATEAALARLAGSAPEDLCRVSRLRELHGAIDAAGLCSRGIAGGLPVGLGPGGAVDTSSDVKRLHAIFDAAVANGMHYLVSHYVDEVCSMDEFSSPDGVEAYLQDGEMVLEWAASAADRAAQELDSALVVRTVGRCKLDPGVKAPRRIQKFNLNLTKRNLLFQLEPWFSELAPHTAREPEGSPLWRARPGSSRLFAR